MSYKPSCLKDASPRPWHVAEVRDFGGVKWDAIIRNENNDPIASVNFAGWDKKTAKANAETIVFAVNMHETTNEADSQLIDSLTEALDKFLEIRRRYDLQGDDFAVDMENAAIEAEAALRLARERK